MTAQILKERLVSFSQGSRLHGNPSYQSLVRWSTEGRVSRVHGQRVVLERVDQHGWHTSIEAYERFWLALNELRDCADGLEDAE